MTWNRTVAAALLGLGLATSAAAQDSFRVRQMTRNDVPAGKGQCDIRLQVDEEVEVALRGDTVELWNQRGRGGRDAGSECNAPFYARNALAGYRFEQRDGRGEMRVLEEPSPRNGNRLIVGVRDSQGGEGRYHFRVSWELDRNSGGWNDGGWRTDDWRKDDWRSRNSGWFGGPGGGNRPNFPADRPGWGNNRGGFGGGGFGNGNWRSDMREYNLSVRGGGRVSWGNRDIDLNGVRVDLRNNGDAFLDFDGRDRVRLEGRWRPAGNDRVELTIRRINATDMDGAGTIDFRQGQLDYVTVDGRPFRGNGDRLRLTFDTRR